MAWMFASNHHTCSWLRHGMGVLLGRLRSAV